MNIKDYTITVGKMRAFWTGPCGFIGDYSDDYTFAIDETGHVWNPAACGEEILMPEEDDWYSTMLYDHLDASPDYKLDKDPWLVWLVAHGVLPEGTPTAIRGEVLGAETPTCILLRPMPGESESDLKERTRRIWAERETSQQWGAAASRRLSRLP